MNKFVFRALASLLGLLLGIGACSYWLRGTLDDVAQEKPAAESAGLEFGKGTDEYGCVKEAAARINQAQSIKGAALTGAFLEACLKTSAATPGFCDDVPKWDDRFKSGAWAVSVCDQFGQDSRYCRKVMELIPRYCDRTHQFR